MGSRPPLGGDVIRELQTPAGLARLHIAAADQPRAVLLLGHGAGGGIGAVELVGLADALPARGITVVRFEQPWVVAGRRTLAPVAQLDSAWRAACQELEREGLPLFVGGRSNGARVACRCFAEPQRGLVLSAFPLHPPGRPERSRVEELAPVAGSALVLQTEGDPFGGAAELQAALSQAGVRVERLVTLPGRGHGPDSRSAAARTRLPELLGGLCDEVTDFIQARLV